MSNEIVKPEAATLANLQEELAAAAKEASAAEQSGGSFLSFKGGMFFNKQPMKDNRCDVIILDSIFVNEWYKGKWDPDVKASPSCYAFGRAEEGMAPHAKVKEAKCGEVGGCEKCPLNQWGTGDKGKGKACKNTKRLALIAASDNPEAEEIVFAKLSVSQLKAWGAYVKSLSGQYKLPPFAVVTTIQWTPDAKSQYLLKFLHKANVPQEGLDVIMRRVQEARESIVFPFPDFQEPAEGAEDEKQPRRKKF